MSPAQRESGRNTAAVLGESDVRLYLTEVVADGTAETYGSASSNGTAHNLKSLTDMMELGKTLGPLPALDWSAEEAQQGIAFLCSTSGTSGVQVIKPHLNKIAIAP